MHAARRPLRLALVLCLVAAAGALVTLSELREAPPGAVTGAATALAPSAVAALMLREAPERLFQLGAGQLLREAAWLEARARARRWELARRRRAAEARSPPAVALLSPELRSPAGAKAAPAAAAISQARLFVAEAPEPERAAALPTALPPPVVTLESPELGSSARAKASRSGLALQLGATSSSAQDERALLRASCWGGSYGTAGDEDLVQLQVLLNKGVSIDCRDEDWRAPPLYWAAKWSCTRAVSLLLEHGADVDARDKDGETALHRAASKNAEAVAKLLLDHKASTDVQNQDGRTALHMAADRNAHAVAKLLLDHRASMDLQDKDGTTALHVAARLNAEAVATLLLDHRASMDLQDEDGHTPLHLAACSADFDIAEALAQHGALLSVTSKAGRTPLMMATDRQPPLTCPRFGTVEDREDRKLRIARLLMSEDLCELPAEVPGRSDYPTELAGPDKVGRTLLHHAILVKNVHCARLFLRLGISAAAKDKAGFTPLNLAAMIGDHFLVVDLLGSLADRGGVNLADEVLARTPLMWAASLGYSAIVRTLASNEAVELAKPDEDGMTALHWAAVTGQASAAETLLEAGAPVGAGDEAGAQPLHFAAVHGHLEVLQRLLLQRAQVNGADKDSRTPLYYAAEQGTITSLRALLFKGADPNRVSRDGRSPLLAAASATDSSSTASVLLLLAWGADYGFQQEARNGTVTFVELIADPATAQNFRGKESWSRLDWASASCDLETWDEILLGNASVAAEEYDRALKHERVQSILTDPERCVKFSTTMQERIKQVHQNERDRILAYVAEVVCGLGVDLAAVVSAARALGHMQIVQVEDKNPAAVMYVPLATVFAGAVHSWSAAAAFHQSIIPGLAGCVMCLILGTVLRCAAPGTGLARRVADWRVRGKQRTTRWWINIEGATWGLATLTMVLSIRTSFSMVLGMLLAAAAAAKTVRRSEALCGIPLWGWLRLACAVCAAAWCSRRGFRIELAGGDNHVVYIMITWASLSEFLYYVLKTFKPEALLPVCMIEMTDVSQPARFEAGKLRLGKSAVAAGGLHVALGITGDDVAAGMIDGLKVMQEEVRAYGDTDDQENLEYIINGRGRHPDDLPAAVLDSMRTGVYHGGSIAPGDYDRGHDGMTLDDWMQVPQVKTALLTKAEFVALRFYTSSSFRKINGPLRAGTSPHPWKMTVYFLSEAVKKMRRVKAEGNFVEKIVLWRGMKDMDMDMEAFKKEGGTELAPMSTTNDPAVAMSYSKSQMPLVFKYTVGGMTAGVCIQFCSLYPKEEEYLYPPLTHLTYMTDYKDNGMHIVEIAPVMP